MPNLFRFPYATIYIYRKRGMRKAIDFALKCAHDPSVSRDVAAAWIIYLANSPVYRGYDEDGA